jgi:hypothetical protein
MFVAKVPMFNAVIAMDFHSLCRTCETTQWPWPSSDESDRGSRGDVCRCVVISKRHNVWILLIMLVGWLYASTLVQAASSPKPRYSTTQAYITDNFQGSIGVVYHGLTNSHTTGGMAIGYYLHKYYHKPLTEAERLKKIIPLYNHTTKSWSMDYPARDSTRDGEASLVLEVGVQFPQQIKWNPELDNKAYIVEKFLHVPICLQWIRPTSFWGFDIFNSFSVGCMIRYLRNAIYVPDLSASNLHNNPQTPRHQVDLKTLSGGPSFYYDILLEWGLVFPVGIYTGLVCSIPLDSLVAPSKKKVKLEDPSELDSDRVSWGRDFDIGYVFAWKVSFDFCRLLKYFNSL